jgi:hypothetical protein
MLRPYLVHSCVNPTTSYQVWKTQQRPAKCRCKFRVSFDEAQYWLGEGVIQRKIVGWTTLGEKPTPTYSENVFCFTNRSAKTPRVMTIEKANIERAFINDVEHEKERIEIWGELARQIIFDLIVPERPDPFYGRTLIFSSVDQRTSVGINVPEVPRDSESSV